MGLLSVTTNSTPVTARGWFALIAGLKSRPEKDAALENVPKMLKPIVRTLLENKRQMDAWRRKHDSLGFKQRNNA